jgi:tetratricopeptide (TPR) repeat protein
MAGYDMTVLGMLLHDENKLDEAESLLRRAIAIFEKNYAGDHQYTASALTELGAVLNSAGRPNEALPLLQRAMTIRLRDYPEDHKLVASTRTEYADTLTRLGRYDEADSLLEQSNSALRDRPGRSRDRAVAALERLRERTPENP